MDNCVEVKLETDVVTGETVAHFVSSLLEFLLYQRNQIPFVCKTFKYLISKWDSINENSDGIGNFQLERQRTSAKQTMDGIKAMAELLQKAFNKNDVTCVRFLFGSTSISPKEAYTINIPTISRSHSFENHKLKISQLNQALISLLTSDCLYKTFSTNLCPTNVFLELEMPDKSASSWDQVFSTDPCDFPASCKEIVINLVHTLPAEHVETKCCNEMVIFEDISNLSLESDDECLKGKDNATSDKRSGWWEACTIVKGFKQKTLKGSNIWQ